MAWHNWIPCSGSHMTEIQAAAGLCSPFGSTSRHSSGCWQILAPWGWRSEISSS